MDRSQALDELPNGYAQALRLRDQNMNHEGIAASLGIEPQAVEPLLRLAEAKLASVIAAATDAPKSERTKDSW